MLYALLAGCPPKEADDLNESAPPLETGAEGCDTVAPVITGLVVSNGGLITGKNGEQYSILVDADIQDDDANIDTIQVEYWYAAGSAPPDTTTAPYHEATHVFDGYEECGLSVGNYGTRFGVTGSDFEYNTVYTFGVVVTDHDGKESEPAFATGTTPMEDGSDGTATQ